MAEHSVAPVATGAKDSAWTPLRQRRGYVPFLAFSQIWERRIAIFIVLVQAVWAIAVPIKNVAMITNPVFRADSIDTENSAYAFLPSENATVVVPGKDVVPLLQKVLSIVLGSRVIRGNFEAVGSFDLDTAYQLLSPEDFHVIAQYYAVVFQATEFPGGVMTPRPRYFSTTNESELPTNALGVWIRPTDVNQSDWFLKLSCSAENTKLDGTRCFQGNTSDVCYDFPKKGDVRSYERMNLESFRNSSGMANSIGLLFVIEVFHSTMAALFSTKTWKKTLETVQFVTNADAALNNAFSSVYASDGRPLIAEKHAAAFSLPTSLMQTKNLESCVNSEVIASRFYTKAFVLKLIQSALVEYDVYNPEDALIQAPNQTDTIVSSVLSFDLALTSGARYGPLSDAGSKRFAGVTLATVNTASMHLKLDKKLNGEQVFGSSVRMLEYMAYYPEYYSYQQHEVKTATTGESFDQVSLSILGSGTSGLFTFKGNWWGNTMAVYRLRERPRDPESAAQVDPWWDDEAKFALWFEKLERTSDAPFHMFDKYMDITPLQVVLNDNPVTACHRAFFKALTKIAFLSLLSLTQLPSYLLFMSNINGATAWFKSTLRNSELYGETIDGSRFAFSYSLDAVMHRDDGSAWVAVPLLHAMLQSFNRSETLRMLTVEFNQSFGSLVATEYGLIHFTDMAQCRVGFAKNNVTGEDNTIELIMDKLYPSVASFFGDLLDAIPTLRLKMKFELENATDKPVQMVDIRQEMIKGSPSGPASVSSTGSPVFWIPTAFTVGMLKFWPAITPPPSVVEAYRNVTTCYDTLEMRYLNESVRCWVEPNNVLKTRVEHKSILMGKILFSLWSTSLVLNLIASFIAAGFVWRLVKAWRVTRFRCVSIWVALQLNFQGFGVLSFAQIVLLTLSTIPLLLGYHIPVDNVFIMDQNTQHIPKVLKDFIVTLSVSWFYRLGFEIVNQFVVLREVSYWFSNFRLRGLSMLLIFILRIATPDQMHSPEYEIAKLLLTCSLSISMGIAGVLVPVYWQRRHRAKIIQPTDAKSHNIVITSINKHGMPLNKYGLVGFSRRGWSLTGLIVEGWEVVKHRGKNRWVAVKDMCRIPLVVDENGDIKSLL